jgi:hypothetical protein
VGQLTINTTDGILYTNANGTLIPIGSGTVFYQPNSNAKPTAVPGAKLFVTTTGNSAGTLTEVWRSTANNWILTWRTEYTQPHVISAAITDSANITKPGRYIVPATGTANLFVGNANRYADYDGTTITFTNATANSNVMITTGVNVGSVQTFTSNAWSMIKPSKLNVFLWSLSRNYVANDIVIYAGRIYRANDTVPANTPFKTGGTGATWSLLAYSPISSPVENLLIDPYLTLTLGMSAVGGNITSLSNGLTANVAIGTANTAVVRGPTRFVATTTGQIWIRSNTSLALPFANGGIAVTSLASGTTTLETSFPLQSRGSKFGLTSGSLMAYKFGAFATTQPVTLTVTAMDNNRGNPTVIGVATMSNLSPNVTGFVTGSLRVNNSPAATNSIMSLKIDMGPSVTIGNEITLTLGNVVADALEYKITQAKRYYDDSLLMGLTF